MKWTEQQTNALPALSPPAPPTVHQVKSKLPRQAFKASSPHTSSLNKP